MGIKGQKKKHKQEWEIMWSQRSLENTEETMFLLQKTDIFHPESADGTKTAAAQPSFP